MMQYSCSRAEVHLTIPRALHYWRREPPRLDRRSARATQLAQGWPSTAIAIAIAIAIGKVLKLTLMIVLTF